MAHKNQNTKQNNNDKRILKGAKDNTKQYIKADL